MSPLEHFDFCPRCGSSQFEVLQQKALSCGACGFLYYFNPAVSSAVFITREDGRVLLIRRAREPGFGKWALPGGFVDLGETAESAATREVREEVGVELESLVFLCSFPNVYSYAGVFYPVLDLFFTATIADSSLAVALEDVASVEWFEPQEFEAEELAFASMRQAWKFWRGHVDTV